jgi:hypothetical protein
LKKTLSPIWNGLLVITIMPAIAFPIVFIAAKPKMVPPTSAKKPAIMPISSIDRF